jgi:predicted nucleic acid-binding protein
MRSGLNATDRVLVDTNVLVYAMDPRDPVKQRRAADLLDELVALDRVAVSAQSLSEFFSVATTRLPEKLTRAEARDRVDDFASAFLVLGVTDLVVLEACRGSADHGLSIWDALIWSCAKLNQVRFVLTEDAPHGHALESVTYLNPFDSRFALPV